MDYMTSEKLGREILSTARSELYLSMRFLDAALAGFTFETSPAVTSTATDGETLYFQPRYLLSAYDKNPVQVNRAYLHNVLHCIFSHLYLPSLKNRELWDLCCDICVESIIDSLDLPCLRALPSLIREEAYRRLNEKFSLYTPGRLYRLLENDSFYTQNAVLLEQDFCVDTHRLWPGKKENQNRRQNEKRTEEKWQEIGDRTRTGMETFQRAAGTKAGKLLDTLRLSCSGTQDYDYFLRRFASWREVLRIDEDTFDNAYYSLGMELYGCIPLIEPLEYREEKNIRSLIIAIDTSGSVRGRAVKYFLEQTFQILTGSRYFFRHMRIRLLQFDTIIQDDILITEQDQLAGLSSGFQVKGFGGTDYRSVFRYIDSLLQEKKETQIQGLMILTDGYGTYPSENPGYPTAFLLADFLKETPPDAEPPFFDKLPPWAVRLRIDLP